ncbi:hypothetical protein LR48_Vigan03g149300 [Vigna angularis]|uniref:Uncharacterized protein n=1 Tax=Phaseolus angularis TaxID=3914 RepID=A0A0L9U5R3_PHAAN|nr:hypothetical protein LR48_Vigan03g149300 [Vigna angularis]
MAVVPDPNQAHRALIHHADHQTEKKPLKTFAQRTNSLCECPCREHLAKVTRYANLFAQRVCIICRTKIYRIMQLRPQLPILSIFPNF